MNIRYDCMKLYPMFGRLLCRIRGYHISVVPKETGMVQVCSICGAIREWIET